MRGPINRLDSIWPESKSADMASPGRMASWGDTAKGWEESLESLLSEHPKLAIAAAAAAGIVLGWIVKRK